MYDIHFGLYGDGARFMNHADRAIEFTAPMDIVAGDVTVSGSWACWGTADQRTDGDKSLHLCVTVEKIPSAKKLRLMRAELYGRANQGRVLDYAIITPTDNWSNQVCHVHFTPNGYCELYIGTMRDRAYPDE